MAGQRGIALILVMVILVLLSILGITLLNSTTSDVQVAATYKSEGDAFYLTDAALEFAAVSPTIYSALASDTSWPLPGAGKVLDNAGAPTAAENSNYLDFNRITIYKDPVTRTRPAGTANVKVQMTGGGPIPTGAGTEVDAGLGGGSGFKANYYVITVIADGPNGSHAEVESQIARVVPK